MSGPPELEVDAADGAETAAPVARATYAMPRSEWMRILPMVARRSRANQVMSVVIGVSGIILIALENPIFGAFFLALAVLFGTGLYCLPVLVLGARGQRELLESRVTLLASPAGLRLQNKLGDSTIHWDAYKDAWESAAYFFLQFGPGTVVVPKRGFEDDGVAAFRDLPGRRGLLP